MERGCSPFIGAEQLSPIGEGVAPAGYSYSRDLVFAGAPAPPIQMTYFMDGCAQKLTPSAVDALFRWLDLGDDWLRIPGNSRVVHRDGICAVGCHLIEADRTYSVAVMVLRARSEPIAVAGMLRAGEGPPFQDRELSLLRSAGEALVGAALASKTDVSLERLYEIAALRTVGAGPGSLFVVNLERAEIVWTDSEGDAHRSQEFERELITATKTLLRVEGANEPPPNLRSVSGAIVVSAKMIRDPRLSLSRCAACRVQVIGCQGHPLGVLSPQERRVAQLLIQGYSVLNAAAIAGISENTVRTYIQRLYRKLGIRNRSELAGAMTVSV
jgi:DNA-binding CsgD family transcriptional regulator